MGYRIASFVFGEEPNWERLNGVLESINLIGLRHEEKPLWLLACSSEKMEWPQFPFAPFIEEYTGSNDLPVEIKTQIEALSTGGASVSDSRCGQSVLGVALELGFTIQSALGIQVFFFASDDEGLNVAFTLNSGGIINCKLDGYNGISELINERVLVSPIAIEGEEEDHPGEYIAEDLECVPLIDVQAFQIVQEEERNRYMQSVCIELWPSEWPNPRDALGLGTWDALADYSSVLQVDFERQY